MLTRWKKRKLGQRDLWDVIVNNDDICFEHILPKLNRNDVKFLFEVNSETRALVKRSSRVGELEKRCKVHEMSSISTLEFAWENRPIWPRWINSLFYSLFCYQVARTNKLELLKWAREEKKCDLNGRTIVTAAEHGNLEMVKYCVANGCPIAPWGSNAIRYAHENNHSECVQYLLNNDCPLPRGWRYEHGVLLIP